MLEDSQEPIQMSRNSNEKKGSEGAIPTTQQEAIAQQLDPGPTTFTSTDPNFPAIRAEGANGARAIQATADGNADGVQAGSVNGRGVVATSNTGAAIHAVLGSFANPNAVVPSAIFAQGDSGIAIRAQTIDSAGIFSETLAPTGGVAIEGNSSGGFGVVGSSVGGVGVNARSNDGDALQVIGHIRIRSAGDISTTPVGQVTLPAGSTSVTVTTTAATSDPFLGGAPNYNVILTPLSDPQGRLWVTRAAGRFTLHTSVAPDQDVPIAFLVFRGDFLT